MRLSFTLCLLLPVIAFHGAPTLASPARTTQFHSMPCPHTPTPDRIAVSWRFQYLGSSPTTGSKLVRGAHGVRAFYRQICDIVLRTGDLPVNCPAAHGEARYHLDFLHRRRSLLLIVEDVMGCEFIGVQGRPDLGSAWGNLLPAGIPKPPR